MTRRTRAGNNRFCVHCCTDKSRADVCESEVEVETPFWAVNSEGKLRAILNNKEFEQAVHKV